MLLLNNEANEDQDEIATNFKFESLDRREAAELGV